MKAFKNLQKVRLTIFTTQVNDQEKKGNFG